MRIESDVCMRQTGQGKRKRGQGEGKEEREKRGSGKESRRDRGREEVKNETNDTDAEHYEDRKYEVINI